MYYIFRVFFHLLIFSHFPYKNRANQAMPYIISHIPQQTEGHANCRMAC